MKGSAHTRLLDAGWSYRTNADRGWVIYRDPETTLWHSRDEAIRVLEAADAYGRMVKTGKNTHAARL